MRVLKLVTSATLWRNKILCQNCGNDITRRQLKSLEDFRLHQLPHHHHTTVEPGFKVPDVSCNFALPFFPSSPSLPSLPPLPPASDVMRLPTNPLTPSSDPAPALPPAPPLPAPCSASASEPGMGRLEAEVSTVGASLGTWSGSTWCPGFTPFSWTTDHVAPPKKKLEDIILTYTQLYTRSKNMKVENRRFQEVCPLDLT